MTKRPLRNVSLDFMMRFSVLRLVPLPRLLVVMERRELKNLTVIIARYSSGQGFLLELSYM